MNKTYLTCSFLDLTDLERTSGTQTANILTCILNSVFSLITCIGNSVILHVIRTRQELQSPTFTLLCCLAASDLLVGLICQPSFVALKITELKNDFSKYCVLDMIQWLSGWITGGVSLLTLSAVSADRLLALTLHLRYNTIVTIPRVFQVVFGLWIVNIMLTVLKFWIRNWVTIPLSVLLLAILVTTVSTFKIFRIVRKHQRQINQQQQSVQVNMVNVLKCRKSAVTVLYVYGLFLIFYLPFCATVLVETFIGYTINVKIAYEYATTAVFINSSLNPFVYCWRITEIRRAVKNALSMQ